MKDYIFSDKRLVWQGGQAPSEQSMNLTEGESVCKNEAMAVIYANIYQDGIWDCLLSQIFVRFKNVHFSFSCDYIPGIILMAVLHLTTDIQFQQLQLGLWLKWQKSLSNTTLNVTSYIEIKEPKVS